jgi:hypothetical protein
LFAFRVIRPGVTIMPPLTLAILASVLHMQGVDATIRSDNKGVDDLLANLRSDLQEQVDPNAPRVIEAAVAQHHKGRYVKVYTRTYLMYNAGSKAGGGSSGKAGSPSGSVKPSGGAHR